MRRLKIEVISWSVKVGRHQADGVEAVLPAICLGELDARDFSDRVPFVGGFQWTCQKIFFAQRLRRQLGINTRGSQELEFFYAIAIGGLDHIELNRQVLANEFYRK